MKDFLNREFDMSDERKNTIRGAHKAMNPAPKKGGALTCMKECDRKYGPASENYDPVALADCKRGCQS